MSWFAFYSASVVVLLSGVDGQAVTCYNCIKRDTTIDVSSDNSALCPENFVPVGASACRGKACLIIASDFGGYGSMVNASCLTTELDELIPVYLRQLRFQVPFCGQLNGIQEKHRFSIFDGMCCFSQLRNITQRGATIQYNETSCACDGDHCNTNITQFRSKEILTITADITTFAPVAASGSLSQWMTAYYTVYLFAVLYLIGFKGFTTC